MVRHFHQVGMPTFTILHVVRILKAVGRVLTGRKVAGLGACTPEMRVASGNSLDISPMVDCLDGNKVSTKGWTGLPAFMRGCLNVLGPRTTHCWRRGASLMARKR